MRPAVQLEELRKARRHLREALSRDFTLRCFFLEKDADAYRQLDEFARSVTDAEIATKNAELEDSIGDILSFVSRRQRDAFPFIFIDPTGWTGFAMQTIAPLLQLRPGEVLINFMTGHILRFAEHPDPAVQQSFDGLFGSSSYRQRIEGLTGQDREDELVRSYCDAVRTIGGYEFVCPAIVLHPENDRTHFHLIYATRNLEGVKAFKQVERKAMQVMEKARADAQQRTRISKTGQPELFGGEVLHSRSHYESLRDRFLRAAKSQLVDRLQRDTRVLFDTAWLDAVAFPLVWDSDVKSWIREWRKAKQLQLDGLSTKDRVPKLNAKHFLVWLG